MRNLDDWLQAYVAYTNELESPTDYHIWCGISAVASVLRRNVWYDMGYFNLYPNMYITLVSPPGVCKKSTAMRAVRELLQEVPGIRLSADSMSREKLIFDLSVTNKDAFSAMTVHSSEFGSALTSSGMDMVLFLTDIFDSPKEWSHTTKSGGTNTIRAPYLNMLAGTTPDWIATAMPLDTIGIGLTSRVCFIYHDTARIRDPFPKLSEAQVALRELLVKDLAQMAQIYGQYSFESEALAAYKQWYITRKTNKPRDPRLTGYFERKPMHLLKVCMILAAMTRDETVITLNEFERALGLFDSIENRMHHVFASVGSNELNVSIEYMLAQLLQRNDGVSKQEIVDALRHARTLKEIDEILDTIIIIGRAVLRNGRFYAINPAASVQPS